MLLQNTTERTTHFFVVLTLIRNVLQSVEYPQQTVIALLLMGTSSSDETVKVFEDHRGSLCQKENMNASLPRSRLETWHHLFLNSC